MQVNWQRACISRCSVRTPAIELVIITHQSCRRASVWTRPSCCTSRPRRRWTARWADFCGSVVTTLASGSCDGSHSTRTSCSTTRTTRAPNRPVWRCSKVPTASGLSLPARAARASHARTSTNRYFVHVCAYFCRRWKRLCLAYKTTAGEETASFCKTVGL